ncbi:hypothetical protein ABEB36_013346 [Hypothenemus hampei]|uniref:BHLH domain-containing protein n=1 Tax=Hypothenemus hampei TaxID=57062 RepID=A0ABD1EC30_HYPHA
MTTFKNVSEIEQISRATTNQSSTISESERVKRSLFDLKQILLNCNPDLLSKQYRDGPRQGEFEELDILEMTIDYWTQLSGHILPFCFCKNVQVAEADSTKNNSDQDDALRIKEDLEHLNLWENQFKGVSISSNGNSRK